MKFKLIPLFLITLLFVSCNQSKPKLDLNRESVIGLVKSLESNGFNIVTSQQQLQNMGGQTNGMKRVSLNIGNPISESMGVKLYEQTIDFEMEIGKTPKTITLIMRKSSNKNKELFNIFFNSLTSSTTDWNDDFDFVMNHKDTNFDNLPFKSLNKVHSNIEYVVNGTNNVQVIIRL